MANKKSAEQKAAEALEAGVKQTDWNPNVFATYIVRMEYPTQWRILEAFYYIIKAWRRERGTKPYFDKYLDVTAKSPDLTESEKEFTDGQG